MDRNQRSRNQKKSVPPRKGQPSHRNTKSAPPQRSSRPAGSQQRPKGSGQRPAKQPERQPPKQQQKRPRPQRNPQKPGYRSSAPQVQRRVTRAEQLRIRRRKAIIGVLCVLAVLVVGIVLSINLLVKVTDFRVDPERGLTAVELNGREWLDTNGVILACGHSARDTYETLLKRSVHLEAKAFAVGVRIEHEQALINQAQYGKFANHPKLGAADYALIFHDKETGRAVYSFCMCPGGQVVASASEQGGLVVNGMSPFKRDTGLANSALVVSVEPGDFPAGPLGGMEFQRKYEHLAWQVSRDYRAPAQSSRSFVEKTVPDLKVGFRPSYRPGLVPADLRKILPDFVTESLEHGLADFERKLPGFSTRGLMIGVETRTSAPVRILRGEDGQSVNCRGLYPTGEGAGYAGGIMSAAMDGYHQARRLMGRFAVPEE